MATRRDLYQSYQFMVQRVVSGLVLRETDPEQAPLRRLGGAFFGGVMIAVLVLAAAGIIGVFRPGGNEAWKDGKRVIIEEESGARFVWLADDKGDYALHPVPNLVSGALLIGSRESVSVSHQSLKDVPRGATLGIPAAPDALPPASMLLDEDWTLCSTPTLTPSNDTSPATMLMIGEGTGNPLVLDDAAMLVRDVEAGSLHLVWRGRQHPIVNETAVLEAMTMGTQPQVEVGTAWLSALVAGEPIAPLQPAGRGTASSALPDAVVGEIRMVSSAAASQYYLVLADTIQPISSLEAQVTLADETLATSVYGERPVTAIETTAAAAAAAPKTEVPEDPMTDPPSEVPQAATVANPQSSACLGFADGSPEVSVSVDDEPTEPTAAPVTTGRTEGGVVLADQVRVRGGHGAVVRSMISPGATDGALFFVSDQGVKFAVTSDTLDLLGYGAIPPVDMPSALVARIPTGPTLDVTSIAVIP
ncbi:type VII secretion protein EccB [Blastococcus sp. Marseille-P5729]|uniref:type VII secretion protein EccB n=1 Tax=Blastococcus sp. Marseille-P5729 TaxID=2086582 RepID=UPI000D108FB7|nr:type VII secretion protein EccB [Blastococcus sp. Marseille-P5729]